MLTGGMGKPRKPSDWDRCEYLTANVAIGWGRDAWSPIHFIRPTWPGVLLTEGAFIWKAKRVLPSPLTKQPAAFLKEARTKIHGQV